MRAEQKLKNCEGQNMANKLPMQEWEIVESYCGAANRKAQIEILADLNATNVGVIREILERKGFTLHEECTVDTENPAKEQIMALIESVENRSMYDCEKVVDAYLARKTDEEIGKLVGGSGSGVWDWRKRRGLPKLLKTQEKRVKTTDKKPAKSPMRIEDDVEGNSKASIKKEPQKDAMREELAKRIRLCAGLIADCLIEQGIVVKEGGNG